MSDAVAVEDVRMMESSTSCDSEMNLEQFRILFAHLTSHSHILHCHHQRQGQGQQLTA